MSRGKFPAAVPDGSYVPKKLRPREIQLILETWASPDSEFQDELEKLHRFMWPHGRPTEHIDGIPKTEGWRFPEPPKRKWSATKDSKRPRMQSKRRKK